MLVNLERTGGFSGIGSSETIDSTTLDHTKAEELRDLVVKTDFFNLPVEMPKPARSKGAADYFTYKISIEDKGKKHTLQRTDMNMEPGLRSFVAKLVAIKKRNTKTHF